MKTLKRLTLMMVALLVSATMAFAQKPNIRILATGGTIAGTGGSSTTPQVKWLSLHCLKLFQNYKTSLTAKANKWYASAHKT